MNEIDVGKISNLKQNSLAHEITTFALKKDACAPDESGPPYVCIHNSQL